MIMNRALCTLGLCALLMLVPGAYSLGAADLPASAAAGGEARDNAAATVVKIANFTFAPPSLQVAVGTTVTWVNDDDIPHTVVSPDKVFKSKTLDTGEKFSYVFSKAGRFPYFCSLHPKMTGEVVVH